MKAVILAGGLGTRLAPLTQDIPKPLLPVGESTVLETQVLALKNHGFEEIYIATFYMSHVVRAYLGDGSKYGVRIHYSEEKHPLGTCGPLSLLRKELDEPFLLMNGDILTTLNFKKVYDLCLQSRADFLVVTNEITTPFHFGKVTSSDGYLTGIEEKPNFSLEILSGVYAMKPAIFDFIEDDKFYGIDSLIKDMLAKNRPIGKHLMKDYWLDIGQIQDYERAQTDYQNHFVHLKAAGPTF